VDERKAASLVQPGPAPAARGPELICEGGIDYADYWLMLHDEAD
jgi:hypothetical protein